MKKSRNIAAPQTTSSGPKCLSGGIVTPEHAPRALHQQLPRVAQVGGEEDDDRELAELRRLELEGADADAEVGAVDLLADAGHARQQQQRQAGRRDRVAVALEHAEVLEEDDREREEQEPEAEPARLAQRLLLVEPVDHHEPEAGQHRHERQQVGIGVGQPDPHHEVGGDADAQEHRAVGERDVGELLGLLDEDRGESRRPPAARPAPARTARGCGRSLDLAALERDDEVLRVVARPQLVIREGRAPRARHVVDRHARAREALVELDPERQVVRAGRGRSRSCGRRAGRSRRSRRRAWRSRRRRGPWRAGRGPRAGRRGPGAPAALAGLRGGAGEGGGAARRGSPPSRTWPHRPAAAAPRVSRRARTRPAGGSPTARRSRPGGSPPRPRRRPRRLASRPRRRGSRPGAARARPRPRRCRTPRSRPRPAPPRPPRPGGAAAAPRPPRAGRG